MRLAKICTGEKAANNTINCSPQLFFKPFIMFFIFEIPLLVLILNKLFSCIILNLQFEKQDIIAISQKKNLELLETPVKINRKYLYFFILVKQ